jgi:hypothetical protein
MYSHFRRDKIGRRYTLPAIGIGIDGGKNLNRPAGVLLFIGVTPSAPGRRFTTQYPVVFELLAPP